MPPIRSPHARKNRNKSGRTMDQLNALRINHGKADKKLPDLQSEEGQSPTQPSDTGDDKLLLPVVEGTDDDDVKMTYPYNSSDESDFKLAYPSDSMVVSPSTSKTSICSPNHGSNSPKALDNTAPMRFFDLEPEVKDTSKSPPKGQKVLPKPHRQMKYGATPRRMEAEGGPENSSPNPDSKDDKVVFNPTNKWFRIQVPNHSKNAAYLDTYDFRTTSRSLPIDDRALGYYYTQADSRTIAKPWFQLIKQSDKAPLQLVWTIEDIKLGWLNPVLDDLLPRIESLTEAHSSDEENIGNGIVSALIIYRAAQLVYERQNNEEHAQRVICVLRPPEDRISDKVGHENFVTSEPYLERDFGEAFRFLPGKKHPDGKTAGEPTAAAQPPVAKSQSLDKHTMGVLFAEIPREDYVQDAVTHRYDPKNPYHLINPPPNIIDSVCSVENWYQGLVYNKNMEAYLRKGRLRRPSDPKEPDDIEFLVDTIEPMHPPDASGKPVDPARTIIYEEDCYTEQNDVRTLGRVILKVHKGMVKISNEVKGVFQVWGIACSKSLVTLQVSSVRYKELRGSHTYDLNVQAHRKEFLWMVVNAYSDAITGRSTRRTQAPDGSRTLHEGWGKKPDKKKKDKAKH
ncbi:hypothetical protein ABW21_db0203790 [Orbilia brochopaga]|nr:hypothetical protein ABW21_db0203790 [Drechslerella brochopaga]